jgi:hypothetical protein
MIGNNLHLDFLSDMLSFCQLFTDIKPHCRNAGGSLLLSSAKICKMTLTSYLFYIPFLNKLHLSKHTQFVKRKSRSYSWSLNSALRILNMETPCYYGMRSSHDHSHSHCSANLIYRSLKPLFISVTFACTKLNFSFQFILQVSFGSGNHEILRDLKIYI